MLDHTWKIYELLFTVGPGTYTALGCWAWKVIRRLTLHQKVVEDEGKCCKNQPHMSSAIYNGGNRLCNTHIKIYLQSFLQVLIMYHLYMCYKATNNTHYSLDKMSRFNIR